MVHEWGIPNQNSWCRNIIFKLNYAVSFILFWQLYNWLAKFLLYVIIFGCPTVIPCNKVDIWTSFCGHEINFSNSLNDHMNRI